MRLELLEGAAVALDLGRREDCERNEESVPLVVALLLGRQSAYLCNLTTPIIP
jgi:hypothetical protein